MPFDIKKENTPKLIQLFYISGPPMFLETTSSGQQRAPQIQQTFITQRMAQKNLQSEKDQLHWQLQSLQGRCPPPMHIWSKSTNGPDLRWCTMAHSSLCATKTKHHSLNFNVLTATSWNTLRSPLYKQLYPAWSYGLPGWFYNTLCVFYIFS